ncbi:MAG: cytochrome c maturation protein CcmE [Gaiellales bacterium]
MRNGSPARLVIALSVAAVLAVFLLYTSVAGGGKPSIGPRALAGKTGEVALVGNVVGPVSGDSYGDGLRFHLRDIEGADKTTIPVVYRGSVPDLFRPGRHIVVDGKVENGVFVAARDSMITKCPSKYEGQKQAS